MNYTKKYTAIQVKQEGCKIKFYFRKFAKYLADEPQSVFDTEEEALESAYKENKYGTWLIVPIIKFDI
jgi:hypothetical protein